MRWFPLVLLLGAPFAAAQNTPSPATTDAEAKKVRVEGTVLSLSGEVVRKATVRLQGGPAQPGQGPANYSETSDNAGKFVFEDVAPGRYVLSAEKPGFVPARYGARSTTSPGTPLFLTAGMEMKDLSIKMTPQGVIAGKVMDQDGDPVTGVQIQVMNFGYVVGRRQLIPAGSSTTNDLGEYRISNLAPGRYYLSANDRRQFNSFAQERPGRAGVSQEGNITTYYPNAPDASNAVPIDVAAGGEMRGIDIRLLHAKVYTVRGKALDPAGGPVQAILSLSLKDDNNNFPFLNGGGNSAIRPDGSFEFRNVVPGAYVLQLMQVMAVNGGQAANLTGRTEVTVRDRNIDNLVLPLGPGPEITGTVKLEDGDIATLLKPAQGAPGGTVSGNPIFSLPSRVTLMLRAVASGANTASAQVKEDGTFRFDGVGANKYALNTVALPQGTYLKSARFGGQDVTNATIDLTSGAGGTLDLLLSTKVASVSGSVHNEKGEAVPSAMVTLWPKIPDAGTTGGVRPGVTDQNGGFKFQGLAPGDYYVAAWEELDLGLAQGPDFLSHFTGEASSIKLTEGGQESRDLKLVPGDKIAAEIAKLP